MAVALQQSLEARVGLIAEDTPALRLTSPLRVGGKVESVRLGEVERGVRRAVPHEPEVDRLALVHDLDPIGAVIGVIIVAA